MQTVDAIRVEGSSRLVISAQGDFEQHAQSFREGSVVGATAQIPAESVAAGAPARVKKPLDGVSAMWVDHGSREYVKLSRSYLQHGIGAPEVHDITEVEV